MPYTIKQVAEFSGLTTRTLRYYDQIGLLKPAGVLSNGYRTYDETSLELLQQVLFFREVGIPLKKIKRILYEPGFNPVSALEEHRRSLKKEIERLHRLIKTIDQTIDAKQEHNLMNGREYFSGFNESFYENEVKDRWGSTPQFQQSSERWNSYSIKKRNEIKLRGDSLIRAMVGEGEKSAPGDEDIQQAIRGYLDYVNQNFYDCDIDCLKSLSEMWVNDARFLKTFNHYRKNGAEFVRQAVEIFVGNSSEST
jgi:DNA-binding transcriptional MerR regulator